MFNQFFVCNGLQAIQHNQNHVTRLCRADDLDNQKCLLSNFFSLFGAKSAVSYLSSSSFSIFCTFNNPWEINDLDSCTWTAKAGSSEKQDRIENLCSGWFQGLLSELWIHMLQPKTSLTSERAIINKRTSENVPVSFVSRVLFPTDGKPKPIVIQFQGTTSISIHTDKSNSSISNFLHIKSWNRNLNIQSTITQWIVTISFAATSTRCWFNQFPPQLCKSGLEPVLSLFALQCIDCNLQKSQMSSCCLVLLSPCHLYTHCILSKPHQLLTSSSISLIFCMTVAILAAFRNGQLGN